MNIQREQVADALLTAAIVGVGILAGNPVLTAVVGGIGVNWAADLTRGGWKQACQRLLGPSGLLNHDLQQALARAFDQALRRLEQTWWETPRGQQMRRVEPEAADEAANAFKLLQQDASAFCAPDHLGRAAGNAQVQQLLYGDEAAARRALAAQLAVYLHGHDPQLVAFIERNLVRELAFCFGEELKADRPESHRAWRAFQRLLLEGLQTGLDEIRADQQEIRLALEKLLAWAGRMEALGPEGREPTGLPELEAALATLSAQMAAGFEQVQAGLVELPERIRPVLRQELGLAPVPGHRTGRPPTIPTPPPAPRLFGREHFLSYLVHELIPPAGEAETPAGQPELTHDASRITSQPLALTALRGLPGVGKTALALALANHPVVAAAFPDGRAWLPLGPQPDVFTLLGRLLEQFGAPSVDLDSVEKRADRLRAVLAGKACLLLLDDVWQAGHARPFVEACQPPARALFTTRHARIAADLHAINHEVRVLKPEPAVAMLADAGADAAAAVTADRAGAEALAQALGYLPLALHVAGRRLDRLARADGAAGAVARLGRELERRLLALTAAQARPGLAEAEPSLEAILALSYDALPDDVTRRAFCRLAVCGGQPLDFDATAMAAVWEADEEAALDLCITLLDTGLLEAARGAGDGKPSGDGEENGAESPSAIRYSLHQVIATFAAARLAADPAEAWAAGLAHARHYAGVVDAANDQIAGDRLLEGLAWLDAEIGQVRRAVEWARAQRDGAVAQALRDLVVPLRNYAIGARHLEPEYGDWLASCLLACRALGDKHGEANVLKAQGDVLYFLKQTDEALARYEQALTLFRAVGDRLGEANVLQAQGDVLYFLKQTQEALERYDQALGLYRQVGARLGEANTLKAIGDVYNFRDERDAALASYEVALGLYRQVGARLGEANVLKVIGDVHNFRDERDAALASYEVALALFRQVGDRLGEANTLKAIGDVRNFRKELDEALASYEVALGLYRQVSDRLGEANVLLALGRAALTSGETDQGLALLAQARELYASVGDRVGLTNIDIVLARHAAAQGDLVAAVEYMQSAAGFAVEVGHPLASQLQAEMAEQTFLLAQQHESLGDAARAAGHPQTPGQSSVSLEHYQAAITGYDRAQQLYTGLQAVDAAVFAALGVGRCLVKSGAWYRGLNKLRHEVLPAFRASGNVLGKAQTFHQIGFVHQLLGDYELAEMGFQDAIRHYRQADDELGVANVKVSLGHLAIQMQELEKAIAVLNEALPVLEHRDGAQLTRAERLLALAQEALHQQAVLA